MHSNLNENPAKALFSKPISSAPRDGKPPQIYHDEMPHLNEITYLGIVPDTKRILYTIPALLHDSKAFAKEFCK